MKILLNNYSIIKNSIAKKYSSVFLVKSNLTIYFLDVLFREGIIRSYNISKYDSYIVVYLKYYKGVSVLQNITSISSCDRYIFYSLEDVYKWKYNYYSRHCFLILSTSKNLISSNEINQFKVGGKVLCVIN